MSAMGWHLLWAPPAAGVIAAAALAAGRWRSWRGLAHAAGAASVAAGWALALAWGAAAGAPPLQRLPVLAVVAALAGAAASVLAPRRGMVAGGVALAAFCGWWLAGGPRAHPGVPLDWPVIGAAALAVLAATRAVTRMTTPAAARVVAAAGLSLGAALVLVRAPAGLVALALVPGVVALATAAVTPGAEPAALVPLAACIAAVAAAAVLAAGKLAHGGLGPIELAATVPVAVVLTGLYVLPRLRRGGRSAPAKAKRGRTNPARAPVRTKR